MPHPHDHHFVDEQPDDDRRRAQQHVIHETHDGAERRIPAVLGQMGSGEHADRRTDDDAEKRHHDASVQGIEQPTGTSRWGRIFGEHRHR